MGGLEELQTRLHKAMDDFNSKIITADNMRLQIASYITGVALTDGEVLQFVNMIINPSTPVSV